MKAPYDNFNKVAIIKWLRDLLGLGLWEAKFATEFAMTFAPSSIWRDSNHDPETEARAIHTWLNESDTGGTYSPCSGGRYAKVLMDVHLCDVLISPAAMTIARALNEHATVTLPEATEVLMKAFSLDWDTAYRLCQRYRPQPSIS